jgi:hypothetical protein
MRQQGGSMIAILKKKKQWEFEQAQRLELLLRHFALLAKTILIKIYVAINFFVYLVYKLASVFLCLVHIFFVGPRLVIRRGPNGEFSEVEVSRHQGLWK